MNINFNSPITTCRVAQRENQHKKVTFGSTRAVNHMVQGKNLGWHQIVNRSDIFRSDLDWKKLALLFDELFPHKTKVVIHAASDLSEVYSAEMALIDNLGEKGAKRFFPTRAKEFDEAILKNARKGIIGIDEKNIPNFQEKLSTKKIEDFFKKADPEKYPPEDYETGKRGSSIGSFIGRKRNFLGAASQSRESRFSKFTMFEVKNKLKKRTKLKQSDIREYAKKKQTNPIILMFRNAFYLVKNDKETIAKNLYENLKPGSLFITGEADKFHFGRMQFLKDAGFKNIEEMDFYEKLKNKSKNDQHIFIRP